MAYIKNTWVDQNVERPRTYELQNNADGSVTFVDRFGNVTEIGTPVNADNMNHIEDGIVDHENRITVLENAGDASNFLNKSQITNCLLEVPQRIKYDLTDGVLTIKAGSQVIVPYGVEDLTAQYPVGATFLNDNFKVADTQYEDGKFFVWAELVNDCVSEQYTSTGVYTRVVSITLTTFKLCWNTSHYSVTTTPSYDHGAQFYNATTNECWNTTSDGTIANQLSLPFCIVTSNTSYAFASIDQVFNGMGYIGSTVWVDKGVKGLIPNGRNEDGTLKNIEFTTDKLLSSTTSGANHSGMYITISSGNGFMFHSKTTSTGDRYYDWDKNLFIGAGDVPRAILGEFQTDANKNIINYDSKLAFHAPDIQDVVRKSGDTMSGVLELYGTSSHLGLFGGSIFTHNMNISMDTAPSSNIYFPVVEHQDKNNTRKSRIESFFKADGAHGIQLSEKHGSNYCAVTAGFDANGNPYTYAPHCNVANGIVTQVAFSKAGNGYCKFGNGLIIQWGATSTILAGNQATVTFPLAFPTVARVVADCNQTTGEIGEAVALIGSVSKTNFKVLVKRVSGGFDDGGPVNWIAVGY